MTSAAVYIGRYKLAGLWIDVYYEPNETGASFCFAPERAKEVLPIVVIGFDYDRWDQVLANLMHEVEEFTLAQLGYRFYRSNDYGNDHSQYIFILNHPQFSDVIARTAIFMAQAVPHVCRAFGKHLRQKKLEAKEAKKKVLG